MKRFNATIEYLPGGREAIIELTDGRGNWFGSQWIKLPRAKRGRSALYEQGYDAASVKAATHGGVLETFKAIKA
jgi:hypothetical protein